jgi:hypothetical protein
MILGNPPTTLTIPQILSTNSTPTTRTNLVLLHILARVLVLVLILVLILVLVLVLVLALVLQLNLSTASRFRARILQLGGPRYRGGRYCQDSAS